jgi:hypothetical protein
MKLKSFVLIGVLTVGGCTLVQAQQLPALPQLPKAPSPPWGEKGSLRTACLEEAQRLCSGKQGQEAAECRKSNAEKLCCGCKVGDSK